MSLRSDIAFTPAVKAAQRIRGSRESYEKTMSKHDWSDRVAPALAEFIAANRS